MFYLPSSIKITEQKKNYGVFEIAGLYPGYGTTIGNALRRVLLSSIEGAAVTSFKIKGVDHEFSTIPYVAENVLDIMLNLKQLRVKIHGNEPQQLKLKAKGEQEIRAKDFEPNAMVEIMNPELLIATLTNKKSELEIEVIIEKGLGYSRIEERKKEKIPIGTIAVDAIFSPIQYVNFEVENMRVGDRTDYNRLIIKIETDGSFTPQEVLSKSAEILEEHFNYIKENLVLPSEESSFKSESLKDPKEISIENLDFSARTKKALLANGIKTLAGLLRYKEETLKDLEGLGEKSIEEIKKILSKLEYTLK
ncbi:MAG: DNA-directed RNA polymerase subunit alpha [Candidatus Pacebacteria bacterium]|nr:DNA-directed RNA polymerase subunit alpha [Candidatus Paceibacterota bacterium]